MHIYLRKALLVLVPILAIAGVLIWYVAYSSGYFAKEAIFATERGAINGYDPVAYFKQGQALPGSDQILVNHQGVVWRFHSEENKRSFLSHPEKYIPQYGGYCAYAMSQGYTAYSDPTAWAVVSGQLYLNYNLEVKAEWDQDRGSRIASADNQWLERNAEENSNE